MLKCRETPLRVPLSHAGTAYAVYPPEGIPKGSEGPTGGLAIA